jgi:hypothetical protein
MRLFILFLTAVFLPACSSNMSLSPAQLIGDSEADVAVQEFLLSSKALAYAHGMDFRFSPDAPSQTVRSRVSRDLFGFPIRQEVAYSVGLNLEGKAGADFSTLLGPAFTPSAARAQYIKSGAYASMILCRNYLSGLRDRNEYFEFLQKELNVAGRARQHCDATIERQRYDKNGSHRRDAGRKSGVRRLRVLSISITRDRNHFADRGERPDYPAGLLFEGWKWPYYVFGRHECRQPN